MKHFATPAFWKTYKTLPPPVQRLADRNYALLKNNPNHPSLHFKHVDRFRSVRVGLHFRALSVDATDGVVWFWIGSHADYDKLVGSRQYAPSDCAAQRGCVLEQMALRNKQRCSPSRRYTTPVVKKPDVFAGETARQIPTRPSVCNP